MISSAVACAGSWPVTAATNSSRSSVYSVDVGRPRSRLPCAARRAGARSRRTTQPRPSARPGDLDLPARDHVEAVARPRPRARSRSRPGPSARPATPARPRASPAAAAPAARRRAGDRCVRVRRCACRSTAGGASPRARGRGAAGPSAISAQRIPATWISSGASRPPMPDRADQDPLEHAEHPAQHLVRDGPLHDRRAR